MSTLYYKEGDNMLTLDEGEYRFHATIGNVNIFSDAEQGVKKQRVLLTNIHNTEDTVHIDKDWFYIRKMVNLGKKNFSKTISFSAHCKRFVIKKSNGKLHMYAIWKSIRDIELGDE